MKQHSDKKPLEGNDKDWYKIYQRKMKLCNHAERLNANKKSEYYPIDPNNLFVLKWNGRNFCL